MERNTQKDEKEKVGLTEEPGDDDWELDQLTAESKAAWIEDHTIGPDSFSKEMRKMYWDTQPLGLIEGGTQKDEEKKGLTVGRSAACPCSTTPKETKWSEAQWKKHWANLRAGHLKRIEQLHKETRE
jgi:hypothetical protein